MASPPTPNAEKARLAQDDSRAKNWKRWGPYLSERQWGTVREDYSADGDSWAKNRARSDDVLTNPVAEARAWVG